MSSDSLPDSSPDALPPWKIVQEEELLKTRIFRVLSRDAHSQLEPTRRGDFVVLDAPNWVNIIALTEEGELVGVEQYRHGIDALTWEIPGGMVDPGETFAQAARRELAEETGYHAEHLELIGVVSPNPAFLNNRCGTILARGLRRVGELSLDEHEELRVVNLREDAMDEAIRSGRVHNSLVVAAWMHYRLWRQSKV